MAERDREAFLSYVREVVAECEREQRRPTVRGKLELLAFSLLVALDGEAASLPGYRVIPVNVPMTEDNDIAGGLHNDLWSGGRNG